MKLDSPKIFGAALLAFTMSVFGFNQDAIAQKLYQEPYQPESSWWQPKPTYQPHKAYDNVSDWWGNSSNNSSNSGYYYDYDYDYDYGHNHNHGYTYSHDHGHYHYTQPQAQGTSVSRLQARFLNSQGGRGAIVQSYVTGSPLHRITLSGGTSSFLERNDRITELEGEHVHNVSDLSRIVKNAPNHVHFKFVRARNNTTYEAHFNFSGNGGGQSGGSTGQGTRFGAYVATHYDGGVRVTSTMPNTPSVNLRDSSGSRVALQRGDVITHVNGTSVNDEPHYRRLIAQSPRSITLTIQDVNSGDVDNYTATLRY